MVARYAIWFVSRELARVYAFPTHTAFPTAFPFNSSMSSPLFVVRMRTPRSGSCKTDIKLPAKRGSWSTCLNITMRIAPFLATLRRADPSPIAWIEEIDSTLETAQFEPTEFEFNIAQINPQQIDNTDHDPRVKRNKFARRYGTRRTNRR